MATEEYVNPLYASFLAAYDIGDDTAASVDPDLFKQYVALRKTAQDYAKTFNVAVLRRESDMLKGALAAVKESQNYHAELEGIKSKDRQTTTKALVDRANNIDTNYTRLAGQMSKFDSQLFLDARSKFENSNGDAGVAWDTLFNTLNAKGIRAVGSDPESVGLATQMVKMTMNAGDLMSVTPEQVEAAVLAQSDNTELAAQASRFVQEAQQKNTEVITTLKSLDDARTKLREITAAGKFRDYTEQEAELAQRVSAQAEEVIKNSFGGTPAELSQRLEDLRARDTEYQGLLKDARDAFDLAVQPGQEGLRTRMGRIIANPDFVAWAKDNGFKRLGEAMIDQNGEVIYRSGLDDAQAMARYVYQLRHPDRHGPLFGRGASSNQLVRITATDPEMRAKILEQTKLPDGRYAVDAKGALLSPRDYAREREKQGFAPTIQYASPKEGEFYLKNAEGTVYKLNEDAQAYAPVTEPPGLKFKPAIVYEGDAPARYMTQDDIFEGNAEVGYPDEAEAKAIEAKSPFKLVSEDQLRGVGEIQVVGVRDRLHAGQAAQYGTGAVSLNNGQYTFTSGVKIENLGEAKPDLGTTVAGLVPEKEARREALQTAAERREERLAYERMTPEELRAIPTPQPTPPPPAPEVVPTALDEQAARSESAAVRGEALNRLGVGSLSGVATALESGEAPPVAATSAAESGKTMAWDDAGYKFSIDSGAETITVVGAPSGKSMPQKTEFTFAEAKRLGMGPKFRPAPPTGAAPAAPAPAAPAAPTAPATTGPVGVTRTPKPQPKPREVGALAGSATVTYKTEPKPKEGFFARLAAAREAQRAERPAGTAAQRRRAEERRRQMEVIEAAQDAEEALPEAGESTAPAPASAPASATTASTPATKKRPARFQKIQQAAFPKTEEVGVA